MLKNYLTEDGFEEIFNDINSKSITKQARAFDSKQRSTGLENYGIESASVNEAKGLALGPQGEYILQENIRRYFDKPGINSTSIASHPDFEHLPATGGTVNQYVCTIFIDIKGSTRLSLYYDLEFIYKFKNAVLQTCIEIVRSFDGYVHRLMGDALMAFFGSNSTEKEQAVIDALNCSIMCKLMLENAIKPWLAKQKGFDTSNFGFRIGCNFGDDHEVLWGNYGYGLLGEVSPTGLPVDLAAKLQSLASKNEIMIGQGIIDFINWPEEFSQIKTVKQNGIFVEQKYVTPNYQKPDGSPLNYSMRILNYDKCLNYLPIDTSIKLRNSGNKSIPNTLIEFTCSAESDGGAMLEYASATKFLPKERSLIFKVSANNRGRLKFPLSVSLMKVNHGPDVPEDEKENDPVTKKIHKSSDLFSNWEHTETTRYRGIHTMECEIKDEDNHLIYRKKIAILIK
ncbi:nucleotide-binding domain-containing protein [Pseudomonas guariconensis]|uniref:nucleotide-binding domain-containing protein n=1 Tax=Pseudomonas guariconensis TaxID=1288410 RepID=UPI002FE54312